MIMRDDLVKNKVKKQSKNVPLIIESHPTNYDGYPFITLIQYRNQPFLTIIDNADNETIKAFVLDLCGPEKVNEEMIIEVASTWYKNNRQRYPISFEFSKLQLSDEASRIYRSYNVEFVSRVIGPMPKFEMEVVKSVKRRKRKPIPSGVRVIRGLN